MESGHAGRHITAQTHIRCRIADCTANPMLIQYEEYASKRTSAERLAIGLGWFSLALGAAEILAAGPPTRQPRWGALPRQLARFPARLAFAAAAAAGVTALDILAAR